MDPITMFSAYGKDLKNRVFKGSKAGKIYKRGFKDTDIEVYPGIYTHNRVYAKFLVELSDTLAANFPKSTVADGLFVGAPIASDFSTIKTLGGSIRPLTYSHSRRYEDDHSDPDVLEMVKRLAQLVYTNDRSINNPAVSNMSSSGAPLFMNDARSKIEHLSVIAQHCDTFINLWSNRDLEGLADKLGVVFLSTAQIRRQADKWVDGMPKRRKYVSYLGAYDLAENRDYLPEELTTAIDGVTLGTCRTRVVNAYSGVLNNIITSVIAPIRDTAEHNFEFTFKHRTQKEKIDKINKFPYSLGLDATQYDASVKYDVMHTWLHSLPVTTEFAELCETFARSPFYSSETGMCDGDIYNVDTFLYWRGLPSGIAFTSVLGKVNMVSHVLVSLERSLNRKLLDQEIVDILKGNSKFGIMNMSDDTILLGGESLVNKVFSHLKEIMDVEKEEGTAFLGDLFYKDVSKKLKAAHSMESYVTNWYVPERSINSAFRPYPMFGAVDRRQIFKDHPSFEYVDQIVKDLFSKYFMDDRDLVELRHMVKPTISGLVKTAADIEVLTNYEKIFYKYAFSDISKEVAELFESRIPDDIKLVFQSKFYRS